MRVNWPLKLIFYISFTLLYVTGVLHYVLGFSRWEFPWPTPMQTTILHAHGVVGIWFLFFFGHFFRSHILPSLGQWRHRRTGITLFVTLGFLSLSVPFLYYMGDEKLRYGMAAIHTWIGIAVIVPLIIHIALALYDRKRRPVS